MPFTPFHIGPGVAVKSVMGAAFSLMIFSFTQVVIDLESAYWLIQNEWPVHRFLHSYLGATVVLIITLTIGKPICEGVISIWNSMVKKGSRLSISDTIPMKAVVTGSVIGVYSHVLLDSIMHSDMRPFAPFADGNSLLLAISVRQLHLFCVYAGLLGVGILCLVYVVRKVKPEK
jgi:membrane-bound metal-dependent hydrolase YbcI (DUF457 family)